MKKNLWKNQAGHIYTYGEFFPPELSPYGYNETMAYEYNSLSEKETKEQGFNWYNIKKNDYSITIHSDSLSETAAEIPINIEKEVIQCNTCDKAYNIVQIEIELLQKMNQPTPRSCPNCRYERRFNRTNKPILYNRNCDKCRREIRTPYAPDRPEIVYCEKCYQQEVY